MFKANITKRAVSAAVCAGLLACTVGPSAALAADTPPSPLEKAGWNLVLS